MADIAQLKTSVSMEIFVNVERSWIMLSKLATVLYSKTRVPYMYKGSISA